MKRNVILLAICLSLLFQLSSCVFSWPTGNGYGPTEDPITITVVYPGSQTTITVTPGRETSFTPEYINGKILVGFYGQNSAAGFEYFDFTGRMNGSWRKDYPTTVYAIYEEPDYSLTFTSSILKEEDPYSYYYGGGKGATFKFSTNQIKADKEFYRLLYCCPNLEVKIVMHAEIMQSGNYEVNTIFSFGKGNEAFGSVNAPSFSSSYSSISLSKQIKGKQLYLSDSDIYARLVWEGSRSGSYGLVKNIYYTVTVIPPATAS